MSAGEPAEQRSGEDPADELARVSRGDRDRLLRIEKYFSGRARMTAEDLLQEAIVRVLNGDRTYRPDLDTVRFLAGVMKSIANGEVKKKRRREDAGAFETTVVDFGLFAQQQRDDKPTPEEDLIDCESTQQSDAKFHEWLQDEFDGDDETLMVLFAMFEGLSGQKLCEATGVTKDRLATIRRRIRRKMNEYQSRGAI